VASALIVPPPPGSEAAALARRLSAVLDDPAITRIVVAPPPKRESGENPDAFFGAVVGVLMRHERLDVEVAYAAPEATAATSVYGLPHGEAARALAEHGAAQALPLIRDDAATVLVGRARHRGADGEALVGETYVDSERLFEGRTRAVQIEPLTVEPGVRGRVQRRLPGGWLTGRAVQTGGANLVVEREGVLTPRTVKRSTFYRHHLDWKLVRP